MKLTDLAHGLSPNQREALESLITYLFPRTEEALGNISYSMTSWKDWYREQRIASPDYFQRYLTYALHKGELQDAQLAERIELAQQDAESADSAIQELVQASSHREFLRKLDAR